MKIGFAGASHLKRYTGTRSTHENSISRNVTSQRVSGGEGVQHMEIAFSRSVVSQKGNGDGGQHVKILFPLLLKIHTTEGRAAKTTTLKISNTANKYLLSLKSLPPAIHNNLRFNFD